MITWPTKEQLIEWFLGAHKTFFPNEDRSEGSDAWREAQGVSSIGYALVARLKAIYLAMFPTTATGTDLDVHAEVNLPPDKRRQAASGTTAGSVKFTGTSGTAIPANTELVDAAGHRYRTSEAVATGDWVTGPPAYATADVVSVDTGQSCNKSSGDTLTLVSPISGVDDEADVATALTGARDQETDDELRARLLSWLRYPPGGGNWAHYKAFAEGVGACTQAYVYPLYRGLGTLDVACLGPGITDDNPTGDRFSVDASAIYDYLDTEMKPCTADIGTAGTDVAAPTAQAEDVEIDVDPASGYGPDWTGSFTVSSVEADKLQINLSASPVGTISAGDRILLNVSDGTYWIPCVRTVSSVNASPAWIKVSEELPSSTPDTAAGGLLPAGPGTQEQVDAILDLFDGLTPGDTSPATRRPEPSPEHPTDLTRFSIFGALDDLDSVLNATVTTPATDVTPTAAKYLIRNGKIYVTYT